jgi:hypothetical protein
MSLNELKNLLIEYVRLLPSDCVASIGHNRSFMIFHVGGPDARQGRRRQQIGIGADDQSRRRNSRDLRECVRRAEGLIGPPG